MRIRKRALTFEDVLLVPAKSEILPKEVKLNTKLTKEISLNIPFVSAAMDTVTEYEAAIAMARLGGIGIIHKNMDTKTQALQVKKVKKSTSGMIIDPISVTPDQTLQDAEDLMRSYKISGVPVVDENNILLGILTNRDMRFIKDFSQKCGDIMTKMPLITGVAGTTMDEASQAMHKNKIEKLPIVNDDGTLRGLITIKDINKLANVNTVGFKEDNLVVGDFMRIFKEARDELPNANQTKEAAQFLNRTITKAPQVVDEYTNYELGTMQSTNNPLDMALSREGLFFLVKTPQGIRLTRDGTFMKNDEGTLVTKSGNEVLPADYFQTKKNITFGKEDSIIEVDKNGQMYTNIPNEVKLAVGSKLFIVQPENMNMLKKEGDNLYRYEGAAEFKSIYNSGAVLQGFVEKSNVNAVKMMTQMIETNRLVGMYQKAMQTQMDDMNNDAINKLAKQA
jgi:flagellar basal-body rod protein FlgG